jgi:hypothetical protein
MLKVAEVTQNKETINSGNLSDYPLEFGILDLRVNKK